MKKPLILFPIIAISLVGCGEQKLRKDIENFVSSFSLQESFDEYKHAQYIDTQISFIDGKTTKTIEIFYYDSTDDNALTYSKIKEVYKEDILTSTTSEKCYNEDGKFYYELNSEKSDADLTKYESLVTKFFYKEIVEETYHSRGMYYGDYILDTCLSLQDLITINNDVLTMSFSSKDTSAQMEQTQTLKVNRFGMLETNHVYMQNGASKLTEDIVVTKF